MRGGLLPPDHEPFRAGDDCDLRRLGETALGEVNARLVALVVPPPLDGLRRMVGGASSRTWCAFVWFTKALLSSTEPGLLFSSKSSPAGQAVGLVAHRRKLLGGPIASGWNDGVTHPLPSMLW